MFDNAQADHTFCLPGSRIFCNIAGELFQASGVHMKATFLAFHEEVEFERIPRSLYLPRSTSQKLGEKALTIFLDRRISSLLLRLLVAMPIFNPGATWVIEYGQGSLHTREIEVFKSFLDNGILPATDKGSLKWALIS